MSVRMHGCTYACMHLWTYARMHLCPYACTYGCMHACIYVCRSVCVHVSRCLLYTYTPPTLSSWLCPFGHHNYAYSCYMTFGALSSPKERSSSRDAPQDLALNRYHPISVISAGNQSYLVITSIHSYHFIEYLPISSTV